jgi:hypothetical protein
MLIDLLVEAVRTTDVLVVLGKLGGELELFG